MHDLFKKLNYKGQKRIAVINAEEDFIRDAVKELRKVIIDIEIDQRCPYEFMILFVRSIAEVDQLAPVALHNLTADGILWYCYPRKTSKKYSSDLERDHGWEALNEVGFHGIRMVAIDDNWSAMRFRNIKFIKSSSNRFPK